MRPRPRLELGRRQRAAEEVALGEVTYFVNSRGDEAMGSTWSHLDLTALGRQEEWEDSPAGYPQTPPYRWWHLHDEDGWGKAFDNLERAGGSGTAPATEPGGSADHAGAEGSQSWTPLPSGSRTSAKRPFG
jgi:Bacterial protein of unknown function (DUF899)